MTVRPSPLRVLLVEDSPDDAELVVRALRAAGLDIDAQRVATEPELHAALLAFMPDVVLTDWAIAGLLGRSRRCGGPRLGPERAVHPRLGRRG